VISKYYIGIDLGGTNIRCSLFSVIDGKFKPLNFEKHKLSSTKTGSVINEICNLIEKIKEDKIVSGIGIGVAGMVSADDHLIVRAPNLDWDNVDLENEIYKKTNIVTEVINDVNAIAWGEFIFGGGRKNSSLLAVFMGTGIGSGLILHNNLIEGSNGVAGEIGHLKVVFDSTARECGCGKSGCVEAYLGGKNLSRWIYDELKTNKSVLSEIEEPLHPGFIDEAAVHGDEFAISLWKRLAPMLGQVLANSITLMDPGYLLIGGIVWDNCPMLQKLVTKSFYELVNPSSKTQIVKPELGDKAGLYGASHRVFIKVEKIKLNKMLIE
jgi:glucokinase